MAYGEIYAETLQEWLEQEDVHLIDVREDEEYQEACITGAHLHPLSRFAPDQIIESLPKDKKIVIHCKAGGRSAQACQILSAHAPDLEYYNLEGGILDWIATGHPVKSGKD
ncbi:MAG: rhodanese-like domain-containing protein [Alphaproteobacteria bacterium]|jgi:rhodanese-related sulfurtransferase|nr:rhodanese-like domain-containing protein [Alphaproteobacteria bacterium]MDP7223564.1 rhodanese-like domain-containing protein [Alphaproteobacteria bacterium]